MAIVSISRKFVFLKTRKVAGTSVEALIRPYLGNEDIVPAITPRDEFYCAKQGATSRNYLDRREDESRYTDLVLDCRFDEAASFLGRCSKRASSHMSYSQIRELLRKNGFNIEDFWVFTIDRHPYEWLLSMLLYDNVSYNRTGDALSIRNLELINESAKKYLSRPSVNKKINWSMYSENDQILVDRVVRYEDLREELSEILSRLLPDCSINYLPSLKKNKTGIDPDLAFSDEVKALAQDVFRPVFTYFNYTR